MSYVELDGSEPASESLHVRLLRCRPGYAGTGRGRSGEADRRLETGWQTGGPSTGAGVGRGRLGGLRHGARRRRLPFAVALRMRAGRVPRPDTPVRLLAVTVILQAVLAGFLALAQPGLCPCWMLNGVHPHPFAHAELPHSHGYLFWWYASDTAQSPPSLPTPDEVHARLRSLGDLWSVVSAALLGAPLWSAPPSPPPPRPLSPI